MTSLNMGVICSWECPKEISFKDMVDSVIKSGFDSKYAREMAPRNAFSRAARDLTDQRVIKKIDEDDTEIRFQFTKEYMQANLIQYEFEAVLILHKEHGTIRPDSPDNDELAQLAQKLVYEHQAKRNRSDVTRMVQKIFDDNKGDLVSLHPNGGVYFVPNSHKALVDQVQTLLTHLGGTLNQFVISFGDPQTTKSVADAMADHLLEQIDAFRKTCEGITAETSATVLSRRTDAIAAMRDKLQGYQALLSGYSEQIASEIDKAENDIVQAILGAEQAMPPAPPVPDMATV